MSIKEAVGHAFRNYRTFAGRSGRSEFWAFGITCSLGLGLTKTIDRLIFGGGGQPRQIWNSPISTGLVLVILLPALAVGVRRLHDVGRPGWLLFLPHLIGLIGFSLALGSAFLIEQMASQPSAGFWVQGQTAFVAFIVPTLLLFMGTALRVFYLLTRPSEPIDNRYGPPPSIYSGAPPIGRERSPGRLREAGRADGSGT